MVVFLCYFFMLLSFFPLCLTLADESLIVNLSSGKIRGENKISANGLSYKHFLGIPFANSPVGKLRLAPPESVEPWSGIRDAVTYPPICMQPSSPPPLNKLVEGTERWVHCFSLILFVNLLLFDKFISFTL